MDWEIGHYPAEPPQRGLQVPPLRERGYKGQGEANWLVRLRPGLRAGGLIAGLLLTLSPALGQQAPGLYWQCVAPSAASPNGGYCPVSLPYPAPVQNQARQFTLLTKSDSTVIPATKAIHIGDGTACDVTVLGAGDTVPVALPNVQPGSDHPYSIIKLMAATTCTSVQALY